jgi:hypothetical protein
MSEMKKIGMIFLMAFLIFGMFGFVSAEETDSEVDIPEAGSISGFERTMERFQLFFIMNPEKKANKGLEIAENRLAEIEKLIEDGNIEEVEKLRQEYGNVLNRVEKAMNKIEANGDFNKSQEDFRKVVRIQNRVESHQEKREMIHLRILENQNITLEELENMENIFGEIQNSSNNLTSLVETRKENFETKLKVLSEMSDEELEELLEKVESEEGILQERENRKLREKSRNMKEIEVRERNLERIQEQIENSNMTEEEKEAALERFEMQKENFEEFKERKEVIQEKTEQRRNLARERMENSQEVREEHREKIAEAIGNELEKRGENSENSEEAINSENESEEDLNISY